MFAPRGWISRSLPREMYRLFSETPYFDRRWYRAHIPPSQRWQDPLWHFIHQGGINGLAPSRHFDSAYYLEKNDDVRVARLNPLYHFLAHGQAEGRLPLRSAKEMVHHVAPETAVLRSFLTPEIGAPRVSLLLDSAAPRPLFEGFIRTAAAIADGRGATLRVLFRGIAPEPDVVNSALADGAEEFLQTVEITPVPLTETYSDIPFYPSEVSLASSWSSARAMRHAAEVERSWVLASTDSDLGRHPQVASAANVTLPDNIHLVSNSPQVRNALALALASEEWPTNLPNLEARASFSAKPSSSWHLRVLADPGSSTLAFITALESVSAWLATTDDDVTISVDPSVADAFAFFDEIPAQNPRDIGPPDCLLVMSSESPPHDVLTSLGSPGVLQVAPNHLSAGAASQKADTVLVTPDVESIVAGIMAIYAQKEARKVER